jgi:hypothetical protein
MQILSKIHLKKVDGVAKFVDNLVKNKDKYAKMSDEDRHNLVWKDFAKLIPEKRQTIENGAVFLYSPHKKSR